LQIDLVDKTPSLLNPEYYPKRLYVPDTIVDSSSRIVNFSRYRGMIINSLVPQIFEYNEQHTNVISIEHFLRDMDCFQFDIRAEWLYRADNYERIGQRGEILSFRTDVSRAIEKDVNISTTRKRILDLILKR
jgi:hypothetical protein